MIKDPTASSTKNIYINTLSCIAILVYSLSVIMYIREPFRKYVTLQKHINTYSPHKFPFLTNDDFLITSPQINLYKGHSLTK